jgi:uncharacterized protein YaaN involved in tellurite resistance
MSDSLVKKDSDESFELQKFPKEEQDKINSIVKGINLEDSQGVISYGIGAQKEISEFSNTILQEVKTKDTGFVGDILSDMVVKIKDLKVDALGSSNDMLSKIPLLNAFVDAVKRFMAKYEKISVNLEKIVDELDKARMNLLKDIVMLDNMYNSNLEYMKNLDFYIAAGMVKLKEATEKTLPELKAKAEKSNDPIDSQKLQDYSQCLSRFEKKLHDLKLSRMIAIQTLPQIRLIQNNNQALVEKIQSSLLNTIPLWKNQIVIAISLFKQKKALGLQKEIADTTNELLTKNSELLKQSSIDIAKENERGIVDIESLKKVNNDLITTIEETIRIQREGSVKRQQAEIELQSLEAELKTKLKNVIQ